MRSWEERCWIQHFCCINFALSGGVLGGDRLTREQLERLDELADSDNKYSNKEIADIICKEFARENLEPSTIWRRRRKRVQAQPDVLGKCTQFLGQVSAGNRAEPVVDAVYQQARLKHVEKLTEISEVLEGQLDLPRPHESGSWVPPQGNRYRVFAIYTGASRVISRPGFLWDPQAQASGGQFRLSVESDMYFPSLQSHLPDANLWSQFQTWEEQAHKYLLNCRHCVQEIIAACESETGANLLIDDEWPQEGIFWHFAQRIYSHYIYLAQGYSGIENFTYKPGSALSRLPEQGMICTLGHGASGIACHRDQSFVAVWQKVHKTLLTEDRPNWKANAEALVQEQKQLTEIGEPIQRALRSEIERGTFDRGSCELCP